MSVHQSTHAARAVRCFFLFFFSRAQALITLQMLLQGGNSSVQETVLQSIRQAEQSGSSAAEGWAPNKSTTVRTSSAPSSPLTSVVVAAKPSFVGTHHLLRDLYESLQVSITENIRKPWWLDVRES